MVEFDDVFRKQVLNAELVHICDDLVRIKWFLVLLVLLVAIELLVKLFAMCKRSRQQKPAPGNPIEDHIPSRAQRLMMEQQQSDSSAFGYVTADPL